MYSSCSSYRSLGHIRAEELSSIAQALAICACELSPIAQAVKTCADALSPIAQAGETCADELLPIAQAEETCTVWMSYRLQLTPGKHIHISCT